MTTMENKIKALRQKAGITQEKVAERMGVSRQAVAKWEAGESAPSTRNLLKLAEIFDTTVDVLMNCQAPSKEQPHESENKERKAIDSRKKKENIFVALAVLLGYLAMYLAGRFLWCGDAPSSLMGWLIYTVPSGEHSYLYGWLLSSNLFWICMAISVLPALFGKHKFSVFTALAFLAGLLLGIWLGPNPEGAWGRGTMAGRSGAVFTCFPFWEGYCLSALQNGECGILCCYLKGTRNPFGQMVKRAAKRRFYGF